MYVSNEMLARHTDPRCDGIEPEDGLIVCRNRASVFTDSGEAYCENCAARFLDDREMAIAVLHCRDAGLI